MAVERRRMDEHVVSPELVLVSSPEDAQRARQSLPAEPWFSARPVPAEPSRMHLRLVEESPPPPPSRSLRPRVAVIALLAAAAAAGFSAERLLLGGSGADRVSSATAKAAQPSASEEFIPARTWSWAPKPGTSAYEVTFYRDDRVVLQARATANSLRLPETFRFEAGRYRWTVQSLPLEEGEAPIADSTFVVSAAAAQAANTP